MKKSRIRSGSARRKAKLDYCEVCNSKDRVDLYMKGLKNKDA